MTCRVRLMLCLLHSLVQEDGASVAGAQQELISANFLMALTFKQFNEKMSNNKKYVSLSPMQKRKAYQTYAQKQTKAPQKKGAPKSKAVGKAIGESIAPFLPGPLKMLAPFAGDVGGFLGEGIGTLLGLGDYQVKKNSIVSEGNSPAYMHSKKGSVFVRHREYIGNVYSSSSGDFRVQNFPIQPGLTASMPWLSLISRGFQEWQPHGIVFEFKSNTGMISSASTPAIGMVIMATDYDSYETNPFANKIDMENTQYTTNAKATESFYHPVECAYNKNVLDRLFLRDDVVPVGQPPQFYDLGTFAIASVGCPTANQNLGELWVTYDIELMKPTMKKHDTSLQQYDLFWGSAPQTYKALWSAYGAASGNTLGGTVSAPSSTEARYAFPVNISSGSYELVWFCDGVATTWNGNPAILCTGCAVDSTKWLSPVGNIIQPVMTDGAFDVFGAPSLSATEQSSRFCMIMRIDVTASGAFLDFGTVGMTWANNQLAGILQVFKIPAGIAVGAAERRLLSYPQYPREEKASRERERVHEATQNTPEGMVRHLQHQLDALKSGTPGSGTLV